MSNFERSQHVSNMTLTGSYDIQAERPVGRITSSLMRQAEEIAQLDKAIQRIHQALTPVLSPSAPQAVNGSSGGNEPAPPLAPLDIAIWSNTDKIKGLLNRLSDLCDRIQA